MEQGAVMSHTATDRPPDKAGYQEVLGRSFESSYTRADDIWSAEAAMDQVAPLLLDRLGGDSYVLDVGSGRGRDTLSLLRAGHRVDAIDLLAMPEWSWIESQWAGRVVFMKGDFLGVRLGHGYHGVLDNGCLHHQHPDTYHPYLQKMWMHSVPGATLVLSLFTPAQARGHGTLWIQHDGRLTRDFSEGEARAMLSNAGWEAETAIVVERGSASHHYLVVIARRAGG